MVGVDQSHGACAHGKWSTSLACVRNLLYALAGPYCQLRTPCELRPRLAVVLAWMLADSAAGPYGLSAYEAACEVAAISVVHVLHTFFLYFVGNDYFEKDRLTVQFAPSVQKTAGTRNQMILRSIWSPSVPMTRRQVY